ncbi:MAG: redoxin domain-containing protein [Bacteroidetes bacterium]|jgi:hypothetical protein|nr:redoxin domain-containing protein [Bacteroidota bacterium]
MNKILMKTCLWAFLFFMVACQSENDAVVKGRIENGKGIKVRLIEVDTDKKKETGNKKLGIFKRFKFSTELQYPRFYELKIGDTASVSIVLKPGQVLNIRANYKDVANTLIIEGSRETNDLIRLEKELIKARKEIDSLYQLVRNDTALYINIIEEVEKVQQAHRRNILAYIIENPSGMVSLATLYHRYDSVTYVFNKMRDLQFFKMVSDSLRNKYPRSKHVNALVANTNNLLQNYQNQRLAQIMERQGVTGRLPDIALPDIHGDTLKFSSLQGKYVLLSFWSANNQECINYNLRLQPVYNKYKRQGFEVYQVSIDTSFNNWKKALRFDEISWHSVQEQDNFFYSRLYNVNKLPYNLLVDPSQTDVLAKNISPAKLDAKLNELLN